jgi:hypothetical protein
MWKRGLRFSVLCALLFGAVLMTPGVGWGQSREADVRPAVEAARTHGVPEEAVSRVLSLGAQYHLNPDHLVAIVEILTAAHQDELPVSPFVEKLEEGLAKNVPPVNIEAVLLTKADNFRFIKRLAQKKSEVTGDFSELIPADLTRLAGTLEMGLSREDLAQFMESAPDAPWSMLVIAVENTALLAQIGFARNLTEKIMGAGLKGRGLTSSWSYLSRAVVAARDRGSTDEAIAGAALQALEKKETIRGMMELLGFTDRDLRREPQTGANQADENRP